MDDPEPPKGNKFKLAPRAFQRVNLPAAEADPNSSQQILSENLQRDESFDLPGIEAEIWQQWRRRRVRDFKVFLSLLVVDGLCLGFAARAGWNPYIAVPLVSLGGMITASVLWIVYVVSR